MAVSSIHHAPRLMPPLPDPRRRRCLPPPLLAPRDLPDPLCPPAGVMAHITAVRLKAFKSVAGGWQEFRFDPGLNAIVGALPRPGHARRESGAGLRRVRLCLTV